MRYWSEGNPIDGDGKPSYCFYDLSYENITGEQSTAGFAFGYFISNLLEKVYSQTRPDILSRQYFEFLYPLQNTKEAYRTLEITL